MKLDFFSVVLVVLMTSCGCNMNKATDISKTTREEVSDCVWLDVSSFQVPNLSSKILESSALQDVIYVDGELECEQEEPMMSLHKIRFLKKSILDSQDLDGIVGALKLWRFRNCKNLEKYNVKLSLGFGNALRGEFPHCSTYWKLLQVEISSPNREPLSVQRYWIVNTTTIEKIAE